MRGYDIVPVARLGSLVPGVLGVLDYSTGDMTSRTFAFDILYHVPVQ
jgi:hypothetical protein